MKFSLSRQLFIAVSVLNTHGALTIPSCHTQLCKSDRDCQLTAKKFPETLCPTNCFKANPEASFGTCIFGQDCSAVKCGCPSGTCPGPKLPSQCCPPCSKKFCFNKCSKSFCNSDKDCNPDCPKCTAVGKSIGICGEMKCDHFCIAKACDPGYCSVKRPGDCCPSCFPCNFDWMSNKKNVESPKWNKIGQKELKFTAKAPNLKS